MEVVASGAGSRIVKQVGSRRISRLLRRLRFPGTHGLGHTRLSTESRVDLSHSQPFWGHGYPDLAIVHNGHITNYHQLRRRYEQHGVRFYTENDSEIIAIYVAERLAKADGLAAAFQCMLRRPGRLLQLPGRHGIGDRLCQRSVRVQAARVHRDGPVRRRRDRGDRAARGTARPIYECREAQAKEWRVWQR